MTKPLTIVIDDAIFLSDDSVFFLIVLLMAEHFTLQLALKVTDLLVLLCQLLVLSVSFSIQDLLIFPL